MRKADFARLVGISAARVSQFVKLGLPVGPDGSIDPETAFAWYRGNVGFQRRATIPPAPRTNISLNPDDFDATARMQIEGRGVPGAPDLNSAQVAFGLESL